MMKELFYLQVRVSEVDLGAKVCQSAAWERNTEIAIFFSSVENFCSIL